MEQLFRIDDSRMPVILGSALRVPGPAYPYWGINQMYWEESEKQYEIEWKGGTDKQMTYIIKALEAAGMLNFSQMLRDAAAEAVLRYVENTRGPVRILEIGAGMSTVTIFQKLKEAGIDLDRIRIIMTEPSESRLDDAIEKLKDMGLVKRKHFFTIVCKDTDIQMHIHIRAQVDLIVAVATFHHHAWFMPALNIFRGALKRDGYFIIADWHNSMWLHPNRVYIYLSEKFDWPTKWNDLELYRKMFPMSEVRAPVLSELDENSNILIRKFWKGWEKARMDAIKAEEFDTRDDIWMHEGHRPVEMQNAALIQCGFGIWPTYLLDNNPQQLLDDARLLMVTAAKKLF